MRSARLDPDRAAHHVLQDDGRRHDRPPTKPPPGALCPRSRKKTETMPAIGSSSCTSTAGTIIGPGGQRRTRVGRRAMPVCASCALLRIGGPMLSRRRAEPPQQRDRR